MGTSTIEFALNVAKLFVIFMIMVNLVPLLVWVERRGSAFIQNRFGPNRVGPLGLLQLMADAVKFIFKEEFLPAQGVALLYYAAPVVALIPGALAFAAIPLSIPMEINVFGETITLAWQGYDLSIGIVFVLGVSSLGAYSLLLAGWASANKYSLMGAMRASAQMISYELALGLSLVGILLVFGSFSFNEITELQAGPLAFAFMGSDIELGFLPNWGIFYQPLGALLFFCAAFAECNRLPFDLPEAEAELVAGYHTEYGGFKMLMFYMGEYGHMLVTAALLTVFYFGGYNFPYTQFTPWTPDTIYQFLAEIYGDGVKASVINSVIHFLIFFAKVFFFLWIFIWVRWTLPRFRYDQLMNLGWKSMLPWTIFNTVVTATVILIASL